MKEPKKLDIAEKWGQRVAARGFAQVPNYLLLLNQFLDKEHRLSPIELLLVIQLVGTWWRKDQLPFPSMNRLAIRCGVSERQIQRAVNHLVKLGLIGRVKRRSQGIISSNAYDLAPLVSFLNTVAESFPNEYPRTLEQRATTPKEEASPPQTDDKGPSTQQPAQGTVTRRRKLGDRRLNLDD
jgi:hypothetical protein